jgi:hypothetical protein
MKTVEYFGHQFSVPDWAKYIAMDGSTNSYRVFVFSHKPEWHKDIKEWLASDVLPEDYNQLHLVHVNTIYLRTRTKPKNSLMEIHKNG